MGGLLGFVCSFISPTLPAPGGGAVTPPSGYLATFHSPTTHQPLILSQGALAEREGAWELQREKHPKVSVKWQERCQHTEQDPSVSHSLHCWVGGWGHTPQFHFLPSLPSLPLMIFRKGRSAVKGGKEQRCFPRDQHFL